MTLNRPNKLNCFNQDMFREWREVVEKIAYDRAVKILVITGEGRAFSSGGRSLKCSAAKKLILNSDYTIVRIIADLTIWKLWRSRSSLQ